MPLDPIARLWSVPAPTETKEHFRKNFRETAGRLSFAGRAQTLGYYAAYYRLPPNPSPPKSHNYLELKMVVSGRCRLLKDEDSCELEAGDLFFLNPRQHYRTLPAGKGECRILLLCFLPSLIGLDDAGLSDADKFRSSPFFEPFSRTDEVFQNVIRVAMVPFRRILSFGFPLVHYFHSVEEPNLLTIKHLFSILLFSIGTEYRRQIPQRRKDHASIPKALAFIRRHLESKLNLEIISKSAGLESHYFSHLFNKTTGVSLTQFINRERAALAAELLQGSDGSVTEIALRTGFRTIGHFNEVFKSVYQITPSGFRKRQRSLDVGKIKA